MDSVELAVLSTCQVLTGKLHGRGTESPVRDLYDVIAAATHDTPRSGKGIEHVGSSRTRIDRRQVGDSRKTLSDGSAGRDPTVERGPPRRFPRSDSH